MILLRNYHVLNFNDYLRLKIMFLFNKKYYKTLEIVFFIKIFSIILLSCDGNKGESFVYGTQDTTPPTVSFNTPLSFTNTGIGTTATGVAVVSAAGTVTSIRYTNAGAGYTAGDLPISVTISSPSTDSTGNYIFNETVRGSTSGVEARMRTWDATTNVLEVSSVTGTFIIGETIVGTASSASRVLRLKDEDPLDDGFADNTEIETRADAIMDFTEQNPFGTP